jgi:hypothetical protein
MNVIAMVIPAIAVITQTMHLLLTALLKWALVRRQEEGNFSLNSLSFRQSLQLCHKATNIDDPGNKQGAVCYPIYKSVIKNHAFNFVPDLVHVLKKECFIADQVFKTLVGQRVFLGNRSVAQAQSWLDDNSLIGF